MEVRSQVLNQPSCMYILDVYTCDHADITGVTKVELHDSRSYRRSGSAGPGWKCRYKAQGRVVVDRGAGLDADCYAGSVQITFGTRWHFDFVTIVDRCIEFEVAGVEGNPSPLKAVTCAIAEINDEANLQAVLATSSPRWIDRLPGKSIEMMSTLRISRSMVGGSLQVDQSSSRRPTGVVIVDG